MFSLTLVVVMMNAYVGQIKFVGEKYIMLASIDIRKLKNRA